MVKSSFYSGSGNNPVDTAAITSLKNAAETAATNAATSEANTAAIAAASNSSATDAASSKAAAQASAQAAATSATNAAASSVTASNAANSVSTAAVSTAADVVTSTQNAALASTGAINAASSETNSSTSAASALASKNAASTSAAASAASEINSAQSASSALQSKNAAATSAASASTSAASASTSSTASTTSETNAAASASQAASSAASALASKTSSTSSALEATTAATEAASAIVKVGLTENVGGHKAVSFSGKAITPSTLSSYAGITLQAGTSGTEVNVKCLGKLTDASFSFTAGEPIYAGTSGALVQSASPPLLRIGQAITSTVIELNPTITVEADDGLTPIPPSLIPGIQDNSTGVAITINSNNQVNMPSQPSLFTIGLSSVQGFGNYYRVIGNTTINVGNHFDRSTGVFTAPCSGKYLVSLSGAASDGNRHIFRVVKNSAFLEMSFGNSGDGNTVTRTAILSLSTGDTLEALSYQSSVDSIQFTLALLS